MRSEGHGSFNIYSPHRLEVFSWETTVMTFNAWRPSALHKLEEIPTMVSIFTVRAAKPANSFFVNLSVQVQPLGQSGFLDNGNHCFCWHTQKKSGICPDMSASHSCWPTYLWIGGQILICFPGPMSVPKFWTHLAWPSALLNWHLISLPPLPRPQPCQIPSDIKRKGSTGY